ncbi:MAG TPA: DedA family protein [Bdellovibrionales bacterium]|nr:DedA family protein [Bdellovibrionales bacterium]|tara:strand:- start:2252 stop:2899 length:648 start_codon:yes stop_codon:yes gene_type:complete
MSSIGQSIIEFLSQFHGPSAYALVLGLLLICGLGVPIPEDITLIGAGILAALGSMSLTGALIAGFLGVMIGDAFMFYLGRFYGRKALTLPLIRNIMTPKRIEKAERRVLRNSKFICFTARFLPGLRSAVFLTSGMLGVRPVIFFALDGFAALISVPVWVVGGWWFGQNITEALAFAERMQVVLIAGMITLVIGYLLFKRWKKNKRARALIYHMTK